MSESAFIHHTAEVDGSAQLGDGTKIWNNVQIRENAQIGTDCIVGKSVYIDHTVIIGDRCKINSFVYVPARTRIEDGVCPAGGASGCRSRGPSCARRAS